jgi:Ca2+-binding RTX toxin-like protein
MSYAPHSTMSGDVSGYQLFDIAALQYLYGANTGYATGNNVYDFNALDGAIETIWDAGGHDTLDMSAATHAVNLDLAEGAFSTVAASGSDNLALAFGTVIEDAIGGAYDDRIAGNEAANTLTGNGGADTVVFASNWGNDTITDFTPGEDLLDFSAAGLTFADLEITTAGGDTLISNGDDSVVLAEVTVDDENAFVFV